MPVTRGTSQSLISFDQVGIYRASSQAALNQRCLTRLNLHIYRMKATNCQHIKLGFFLAEYRHLNK